MLQPASKSVESKNVGGHEKQFFTAVPVLIIALYFLVGLMIISPLGNFPLNDDWIYSHAVQKFMETGQIEFVGPNCTSCLLHVVLGAALCKVVGFSHVALRCFTLFMAFANTLAVYWVGRELGLRRGTATFAALLYAANPLFVNLAYSYMTDVAAVTFSTFYMLSVIKGLRSRSPAWFAAGGVLLMCAIAVRQTNVVFVASNVVLLSCWWWRRRHSWSILIMLIVLPLAWYKLVDHIVPISVNHPAAYGWYQRHFTGLFTAFLRTPLNAWFEIVVFGGKAVLYLGLFMLPMLLPFAVCFFDLFKTRVRVLGLWFVLAASTVAAAMTKLVVQDQKLMPISQNLLRVPMVGSLGIMGIAIPNLNKTWRVALTHVSGISGTLLTAMLLSVLQRSVLLTWRVLRRPPNGLPESSRYERRALSTLFCCVCAVAAYGLVALQSSINDLDRYYLILAAPTIVCLSILWRWLRIKPLWTVTIPLLLVMAIYSLFAQQDYMSWNRARWTAARGLEDGGIEPVDIDGGAEYNLQHNYRLYDLRAFGQKRLRGWRWYPVQNEKYIISFSPIPGYETIGRQTYWSDLSFSHRDVLILKQLPLAVPGFQP